MSAALATMMLASCQNEEIVNKATDGRMFTLEVSQGMDSRTTLTPATGGYQTLWSEGDQIYVTSEDGKTTGVLTLVSTPGSPNGTFQGFVFGEGDLKYSVFPVPANGVIDLNNSDEGQIDAPMVGTIGQNGAIFTNACAMVNLNIDGIPQNAEVSVSNTDIVTSAIFDIETGTLKPIATSAKTVVVKNSDESVLVPLFINPATTATDFDLTVSVNGKSCVIENIPLKDKKVSANQVPALQYTNVGGEEFLVKVAEPAEGEDANTALENGQSVKIDSNTMPQDGIVEIGATEDSSTPTVVTFENVQGNITISPAEGSNPAQKIKIVVASDVQEGQSISIDETLKSQTEIVFQESTSLVNVLNAVDEAIPVTVELAEGNYTIPPTAENRTLTISGTEDTEIDIKSGLTYVNGADITFEGVSIQSEPEGAGYNNGFADLKYATFNGCVIDGTIGLDFTCEFNECEFNIKGNYYNVWTWGAGTATFNKCTFNCDGKALLVYANVLDNGTLHQTVNITECTFNDYGDNTVTGKAAIEITNTYKPIRTYDIFIEKTTVNGFTQTVPGAGDFNTAYGSVEGANIGTNVWGNKCKLPNTQINVVIDGVDVY